MIPVDVTLLTVFYNRQAFVASSLQSLVDQDCTTFVAVVVDDGSTDGTYAAAERFRSDRIIIRRQANAGFTPTMADLCRQADTEFIAVHGAGDESLPERLSLQRAYLIANPHVVAVGCAIENVDEVTGRRWVVSPRAALRPGPILGDFDISHGEVMFRRDAYLRAGGYRSEFRVGQASDLFRRLSRIGDFGYLPQTLYRRYLTTTGISAQLSKIVERDVLSAISMAVHERAIADRTAATARLRDDLDRHGLLLPYFGPPSRRIARALASAAMKSWSSGDRPLGRRLARRSVAESVTRQGLIALAVGIVGRGPIAVPLSKLMRRRLQGNAEMSLDRLGSSVHG